jgi:hypothetical protein
MIAENILQFFPDIQLKIICFQNKYGGFKILSYPISIINENNLIDNNNNNDNNKLFNLDCYCFFSIIKLFYFI